MKSSLGQMSGDGWVWQVLVAVPTLRDFCTLPQPGEQLKKGPIGRALEELVQTVNGGQHAPLQPACNWPSVTSVSRGQ